MSTNKIIVSIAIVVMPIARQVGVFINKITNAEIIIKIGITLKTVVYSFKVYSVRCTSDL